MYSLVRLLSFKQLLVSIRNASLDKELRRAIRGYLNLIEDSTHISVLKLNDLAEEYKVLSQHKTIVENFEAHQKLIREYVEEMNLIKTGFIDIGEVVLYPMELTDNDSLNEMLLELEGIFIEIKE